MASPPCVTGWEGRRGKHLGGPPARVCRKPGAAPMGLVLDIATTVAFGALWLFVEMRADANKQIATHLPWGSPW
jgi:hypothetical protein